MNLEKSKRHINWESIGGWTALVVIIGLIAFSFNSPSSSEASDIENVVPTCEDPQIKGNISFTTGEKIYHMPGDPQYERTDIMESEGEQMFCTEQEAQDEGWRHAQVN